MKTLNEIRTFAETNDAVTFDKWCDTNGISTEWLDVSIMNFNDGDYNVYLPEYDVHVTYYNGKLEEIQIIE